MRTALVDFAWDEWGQMGVLASPRRESPWAQDPEALLVFSLEVARDEPRLFDELLDWLLVNESLVSRRRLRAMCEDETDDRLVGSALAWIERHRGRAATPAAREPWPPEPLFRRLESPIRGADEAFEAHGFLRPRVIPTGKSRPPDLTRQINLAFRLRQLLGVGARSEVVRCLLTLDAPWATAAVVARSAGYAKRNVHEALTSLQAAGVLTALTVGTEQRYSIDRARWAAFLEMDALPAHQDWPQLLGALRRILRWLEQPDIDEMSAYMRASQARDLLEDIQPDLAYAGIPVSFGQTPGETWAGFTETVKRTVSSIGAGPEASTAP